MASTSKKRTPPSPAAQRQTRKTTKVNLHAEKHEVITVVGIGASAGGLKALQALFESLPDNMGLAYVVITHLHPEYESHMAQILQKATGMPVQQVNSLISIEKDHVYVIPPNLALVMEDGHIGLSEFTEPRGQRAPIDYFFRSLARAHPNSIGIILSGGGTDGAVGIKAIKEAGGLLMVQHPDEAEYNSMPAAAIATGLADVVLPVKELAAKLVEYARFPPPLPLEGDELDEGQLEAVRRIVAHVRTRTGHDFSQYKRSTLLRRIQRRMQMHGIFALKSYLDHLRQTPVEASALFNDILIGVTSFFRDLESWEKLSSEVIPQILKEKSSNDKVRTWTIGCATGEEAYGLAILLLEGCDRSEIHPQIQVFASDLDENSIKFARDGLYPSAIEADVSTERLERFFTREGDHYRVRREVRDMVLFTHHSVLRDAPFSRLDMITCRNLLIYLEREIQSTVFDIFHYSLNPDGFLFLGNSESAESTPELFQTVDKIHHIYRAKPWSREHPHVPSLPLSVESSAYSNLYAQPHVPHTHSLTEMPRLADEHHKALESHAPPSVLVDDQHAILHVSERAGRYLVQPVGPITTDLLKLIRPEQQLELRTSLFLVFEKNQTILSQPILVQFNGHPHRVILSITPRSVDAELSRKQALIFFLEDEQNDFSAPKTREADDNHTHTLVRHLEIEAHRLREQLQTSSEKHESSSEELKASNEELQSINEEYRSATEELETSKEELQSVNEELQTVNNELKTKLEEISLAHSDLENLMSSTEIAMLFLDTELRIRHYTPGMRELFNITPGDRGRPIKHFTHNLRYSQFFSDVEGVLRTLVSIEREVQSETGEWFLVRMRPYRTIQNRIDGVIFTFVDITRFKLADAQVADLNAAKEQKAQERIHEINESNAQIAQARDLFYSLFDANPIPTALIQRKNQLFLYANAEFLNYFQLGAEDVIGHDAKELSMNLGLEEEMQDDVDARLQNEGRARNIEFEITHPSGQQRIILASIQFLTLDQTDVLITTFIDITERVNAEQQIRRLASELTAAEQAERHRLSQILHDDLQQRIFAIQMQMSFLKESYEKNDLHAFQIDFPQLEEWLAESIQVTRQLSVDLSPPILHGEGLVEAVIWLAAQMQEQYKLRVNIQADSTTPPLNEKVRVLVFYAVRELLFNVVKHSELLEARVAFEANDGYLDVIVSDTGKGFPIETLANGQNIGHGLESLRHRLNLLGCNMNVHSEIGVGTQIIIQVPDEQPED
jgi:two-component system CheB/CheR fusion protein